MQRMIVQVVGLLVRKNSPRKDSAMQSVPEKASPTKPRTMPYVLIMLPADCDTGSLTRPLAVGKCTNTS